MIPDAPHLLKLVRNWLLDTGYTLSDGSIITKAPLQDLVEKVTNSELSINFKLTKKHLECKSIERQNVAMANQLLSHSTACALRQYYADNVEAQNLANFISIVNDWFDIMNSRNVFETQLLKKPFGNAFPQQLSALQKMYDLIESMRCQNKNQLVIFQQGIL